MEILFAGFLNINLATCVGPMDVFCPRCMISNYIERKINRHKADAEWERRTQIASENYLEKLYKRAT